MRRIDEIVAAGELFLLLELLHQIADHRPLRVPENETGADLLVHGKEIELASKTAMIAALGFLQPRQMSIQLLLRRPGRAVDALQHRPLLVTTPVGAGDREEFEGPNLARAGHMRTAAKIEELALLVSRDDFVRREALD